MIESSLYPGSLQIEPMKYGNKPADDRVLKSWESGDWVGQEKKDGAWYQLEVTTNGDIYLFGRTLSKVTGEYTEKITNVPHIESWATYLPRGTILLGEIYVPGGKSNDVTKIMGCTPENAYKRQFESESYGGPIHFYIFDVLRFDNQLLLEVPFIERYEKYLVEKLRDYFIEEDCIELAETYYNNFENHLKEIFAAGGEGMVFKKKTMTYRPGKRSSALTEAYKYKQHLDSIDLICIGLEEPMKEYTGKELETWPYWIERGEATSNGDFDWIRCNENYYKDSLSNPHIFKPVTKPYFYGWKNALRLGAYKDGKIVEVGTVASGLTDADRKDMGLYPENWLNKVIEVECMSTTKDGALRHPVYKRVREDKNPEECFWEEIFS